jgi:hypothetical protein
LLLEKSVTPIPVLPLPSRITIRYLLPQRGNGHDAVYLTAIGLLLGISFGAGLLIREAQSGTIPPRQIFLSCIFMGFAHSMIEDTLLMMALGADAGGIVVGRLIFAFIATGAIAYVLRHISETTFLKFGFSPKGSTSN